MSLFDDVKQSNPLNVFARKVVEETFPQLLQKVLCLWRKQMCVYIDEDFAIN